MSEEVDATQVSPVDTVHFLDGQLPDIRRVSGDAGVVDKDVDPSPGIDRLRHAPGRRLRVAVRNPR